MNVTDATLYIETTRLLVEHALQVNKIIYELHSRNAFLVDISELDKLMSIGSDLLKINGERGGYINVKA